MPWDPHAYLSFKEIRFRPFYDLMEMISATGLHKAIDLGCGTGEQTSILAEKFENAHFIGIDSSKEMLEKSKPYAQSRLKFDQQTVESFLEMDADAWDLIFSNAALQWSDEHDKLFPKIMSKLSEGGQFAVQMPFQNQNALNQILLDIAGEKPFREELQGFERRSPLLSVDEYVDMMFEAGLEDIQVFLKVYPIVANDSSNLLDFIAGSALIPYMERLETGSQERFKKLFLKRIQVRFKKFPAIYSFKRILMYGKMGKK